MSSKFVLSPMLLTRVLTMQTEGFTVLHADHGHGHSHSNRDRTPTMPSASAASGGNGSSAVETKLGGDTKRCVIRARNLVVAL
jgi:hypothetical protein